MSKQKQLYGLIGYPVKHSFSAAMHNAAFSALGIDAEYRLFEVKPEALEDFVYSDDTIQDITGASFPVMDLRGFNVTIPHKEAILRFVVLEPKSLGVREINAVNTVKINVDHTMLGFNTDWWGFSHDLDIKGLNAHAQAAALIGAGGAGKAVAYALSKKNAREIAIYDIDQQRSQQLADKVRQWNPQCRAYAAATVFDLKIAEKKLLVNASSVGMKPNDPLLVKESMLSKDLFVYDLIYNPDQTKLLALAEKKGLRCSNGLDMLLYQGVLAFEHWTQQNAPRDVMLRALRKELNKCRQS